VFVGNCALTVLTFAQCYAIIFVFDQQAFSEPLSNLDVIYFSVVTISSTGYGDIVPKSPMAKTFTCLEIIYGYFLTVIVFASFAGLAFRQRLR
jgi:voltage-gated potassium channel